MPTPTTKAQTIRENRRDIVEALRPSQLAKAKFREFERNGDFKQWCEDKPASCLRRFQISDLNSYEIPTISDMVSEEVTTQFELTVAYPADGRYGKDQLNGLEDAIRTDQVKIETQIGALSYGDYPSGLGLFQLSSYEIEKGENVWFLSAVYDCNFKRAVDLGYTDLSGTLSATALLTGALSQMHVTSGSVSASITLSGDLTRVQALSGTLSASGTLSGNITALGPNLLADFDFSDSGALPTLTTQLRGSAITLPESAALTEDFLVNTQAIGFSSAFAAASKRALYCNNPITNLLTHSNDSTGWSNSSTTDTANFATSPDGTTNASEITAIGANRDLTLDFAIVGGEDYAFPVWIKRNGGADVTFKLQMYDLTNANVMVLSGNLTATDTWQPFLVTGTAGASSGTARAYIRIVTNNGSVLFYGAQTELGTTTGGHAPTAGSTAALLQSDYQDTGNNISEDTGEVSTIFVLKKMPPSGESHYIFDTEAAADRRALYVDSSGNLKFLVNDNAGSLVSEVTLGTVAVDTEYTAVCQWDEAAGLGSNSVRAKVNAVATVSGGSSFTSGGGYTAKVCIGASGTTANTALDGYIQSLVSYDLESTSI